MVGERDLHKSWGNKLGQERDEKNWSVKQAHENIIIFADKGTMGFRWAVR